MTRPWWSSTSSALLLAAVVACGSSAHQPVTVPPPVDVPPGGDVTPTPPGPASPTIPLWPAIKRGVLANGLTYYVLPHAEPQDRVYLWLAVDAGAVQEDDDQRGLAHFVEHMGFNGTTRFPKSAIVDFVEKTGMDFGAHLNAYTSFDETVYQLEVPTDDPALVRTGLDVLYDWASGMAFEAAEVEKERGVVLEEWRLGLGPWDRVFDKQFPVLMPGSRYAERLPIGKPEILKTAPRDALVRFYKDWYRPDLMAVIVVGDIDPAALEAQVRATFGDLQGPGAARKKATGGVPTVRGLPVSIVADAELPMTSVGITTLAPRHGEATEADYRRYLVEMMFGSMLGERLDDLAAAPDAPIRNASAGSSGFVREVDSFSLDAQVAGGKATDALRLLARELRRVEQHGFGAAEFERAKRRALRNAEQSAREADKTDGADLAAEMTRNFFEGEFMCGRQVELELMTRFMPTITLAELAALPATFGAPDTRVVTIAGPDAATLPTEAQVRAVLAEVAAEAVPAWTDSVGDRALIATAPTPGAVVKEGAIAEAGLTTWVLANGATVILKPTDFEADAVYLNATSQGGSSLFADRDLPTGLVVDDVVGAMGLGDFAPRDLAKALSGKVARVYPVISEIGESVRGNAAASDVETMLQLTHLTFTAPRRDSAQFAIWQKGAAEDAREWQRLPEVAFEEEMARFTSGGNQRRMRMTESDVGKVDLDRALALYAERFANAADFTFVLVGNIDLATIKPLVERYLGSLPAKKAKPEKARDIGVRPLAGVQTHITARGSEPKAHVELQFSAHDKYTANGERDVGILSDVLSIRLREVLREDMGGVYGVGAWGWHSRRPIGERGFQISFGCDPARVDELKAAVFTVVKEVQTSGASDDNLAKARASRKRSMETDLRDNGYWLRKLAQAFSYGDDPRDIGKLEPVLGRITSANLKAAAKHYLDTSRYVFGVMTPVAKVAPAPVAPGN